MSDILILGLATLISGSIITPLVGFLIKRSERRVVEKVDTYHKEINGRVSELLETTKSLGREEGKAQEKEDAKNKKK